MLIYSDKVLSELDASWLLFFDLKWKPIWIPEGWLKFDLCGCVGVWLSFP